MQVAHYVLQLILQMPHCCRLAKEGLANLAGAKGIVFGCSAVHASGLSTVEHVTMGLVRLTQPDVDLRHK